MSEVFRGSPQDFTKVSFERKGYESPYSTRYGSPEMRAIWDQKYRLYKQRRVWLAVAGAQMEAGIVKPEEYEDLVAHREEIDVDAINSRENNRRDPKYVGHDILAHISQYAEVAPIGGGALHKGLTSEDVISNEEVMSTLESFPIIEEKVEDVLMASKEKILKYKDLTCLGYTHDQAAEPITLGYRIANYAQDMIEGLALIDYVKSRIKSKGIKGPVGTSAALIEMLKGTGMNSMELEKKVMDELGLNATTVSRQAYPRIFTFLTYAALATVNASTHKFAKDLKTLQSTPFGELAEPRASGDRSSSAMVHKKNPRHAEAAKSAARDQAYGGLEQSWTNAADEGLERGLEESLGKRRTLPEAFLATDEGLIRTRNNMRGFQVSERAIQRNFNQSAPFMALEIVLAKVSGAGADRQEMHEVLALKAQKAWEAVEEGKPNPLKRLVAGDHRIKKYSSYEETERLFDGVRNYVGDAPQRCDMKVAEIDEFLDNRKKK